MAKAIYEHGELERVRNRLGTVNPEEAKRMAQVLGGEVGVEKQPNRDMGSAKKNAAKAIPKHRIETVSDKEYVTPNFSLPVVQSYAERVKMDKLAFQEEFDIKTFLQLAVSILSFMNPPTDYISPVFINKRMDEYYKKIEVLVTSTRVLFPKNNVRRTEQLKRGSYFAYCVLDVIRRWNIERISTDLARMQTRPRSVILGDCKEMLKAIYKPIIILENLTAEVHIKACYNLLYKYLYVETPHEAAKYREIVRSALVAFVGVRRDIQYLIYPLLMKFLSDKCLSYEEFFLVEKDKIMAFVGVTPSKILEAPNAAMKMKKDGESEPGPSEEEPSEKEIAAEKAKQAALEAEKTLVEKGLRSLEGIFPKAGWDKLEDYYDLYPYFAKPLEIKKGYELIAPTDPMLLFCILVRILEELFFGLRAVKFTQITSSNDSLEKADEQIGIIINKWHDYLSESLVKEYLERLIEYCELLASSPEARTSSFAIRLLDEMNLAKRLYFLPHYEYTVTSSQTASTFQKKNITPLFREIRKLRRCLMLFVNEIEKALCAGGAEAKASCGGIENPWAPYIFQVANPVSKRLNIFLGPKNRNNASLVLFISTIVAVLDFYVNNENSWAYEAPGGALFRSKDGLGAVPQFGVDELLDADAIFKQTVKELRAKAEQASVKQTPSA